MHHVFHYVMFRTVRNWLYIFIFLIRFYTVKVESGRKEQSLFQTSIPFFRGIQTRFFKRLKISWLRVRNTQARGSPPAFRTPCVLLSLSYGIFLTCSASAQTPAHFLWLESTGLGSTPASLCRFSCPLRRFHLYLSLACPLMSRSSSLSRTLHLFQMKNLPKSAPHALQTQVKFYVFVFRSRQPERSLSVWASQSR